MSFNRNIVMASVFGSLLFVTYIVWQNNQPHMSHLHIVAHTHLLRHDRIQFRQQPQHHSCQPKTRVAFLKVHKAASSTFANILKRFGYFRNSTFAIPVNGTSHFAQFGTLSREIIETVPPNQTPDILFHHVVYNRSAFKSLLPADMIYVASVREPVSWFLSAFNYYKYDYRVAKVLNAYNKDKEFYFRKYFQSPSTYEYELPILRALYRLPYDFGVPSDKFTDSEFIRNYVTTLLDKDFKFVLIAEHFDESLILFRRYMCWHIKDMFYLPRQVSRRTKPPSLPQDLVRLYEKLTPGSYILYQHFLARFREQLELQGPDFRTEVNVFKKMLKVVNEFCSSSHRNESSITFSSQWNGEFRITGLDCFVMNYTRPMRILAEDGQRKSLLRR